MILLNPRSKVYVYTEAIDFRNGIEGLVRICENRLGQDPYSGVFFLFVSRNRVSIKVLVYDGQGFWCMQKRLSSHNTLKSAQLAHPKGGKKSIYIINVIAQP